MQYMGVMCITWICVATWSLLFHIRDYTYTYTYTYVYNKPYICTAHIKWKCVATVTSPSYTRLYIYIYIYIISTPAIQIYNVHIHAVGKEPGKDMRFKRLYTISREITDKRYMYMYILYLLIDIRKNERGLWYIPKTSSVFRVQQVKMHYIHDIARITVMVRHDITAFAHASDVRTTAVNHPRIPATRENGYSNIMGVYNICIHKMYVYLSVFILEYTLFPLTYPPLVHTFSTHFHTIPY